ncbi:MAG: transcriptional regulator [Thiotrichales bacterium SG8_50]|nr:MAG: transcriptional regulator [Thiotrichales bacterium SG8_50]
MIKREVDEKRAAAFADKMVNTLNTGALSLMISIGHRTRLFDIMQGMSPSTSDEIAQTAILNERYVREWLGAMTVGGIIEHDPEGSRYYLPPEHAACLTRKAAPDNIAVFAQYMPVLGAVEDRIVECFENGGGVPYEEYKRFHEVMAEDSGQTVLPALIDTILPLVSGAVADLERGIEVLDIGCGSGRALNLLAKTYPNSRFTGYDLCEEALEYGIMEAESNGVDNLRFDRRDLTHFNESSCYDLITAFDAIHDQKAPDKVLISVAQALRPEGTFLMQDIAGSSHVHRNLDHPIGPLLYTVSCLHCMSVSLAQGGPGLGAMWGEELALNMLEEAGFRKIETKKLPHDFQNNYYVATLR